MQEQLLSYPATTQPNTEAFCKHENLTEFLIPRNIWTWLSGTWGDAWSCSAERPGAGLLWSLWSPSNSGYSDSVNDCMIWSPCLQSVTDSKYLLRRERVSICLSSNKQAGFVYFPFWLNLFIAKRDKKLRFFMVLELNAIDKFPICWQKFCRLMLLSYFLLLIFLLSLVYSAGFISVGLWNILVHFLLVKNYAYSAA